MKELKKEPTGQDVFVPLEMLSFKTDKKSVEKYEREMRGWEMATEEWEDASDTNRYGMSRPVKPTPPKFTPSYQTIYINLGDKIIESYMVSHDDDFGHDIIVMDAKDSNGESDQYHIKISLKEFNELMENIGAIVL